MKILVLMPIGEDYSYIASGLFKALDPEARDCAFSLCMFSEWQRTTQKMVVGADLPKTWTVATFGSLMKARELYRLQEAAKKDIIVIGNISPDYRFDAIFNFQDPERDAPYEDRYLTKIAAVAQGETALTEAVRVYDASASQMTLHNFVAAGKFLSAYLKTDPHIDDIKAKYNDQLQFKETPDA